MYQFIIAPIIINIKHSAFLWKQYGISDQRIKETEKNPENCGILKLKIRLKHTFPIIKLKYKVWGISTQ